MSTPASSIKNPGRMKSVGYVERDAEMCIAHDLMRPYFCSQHERFLLLAFDSMDRLIRMQESNTLSAYHCIIPPQLWRDLLSTHVSSVIMAHNHPSGIAWPSGTDRQTTVRAVMALDILGISLRDHLIFTDHGHYSFRRAGLL